LWGGRSFDAFQTVETVFPQPAILTPNSPIALREEENRPTTATA
jgi:hypothetical protein